MKELLKKNIDVVAVVLWFGIILTIATILV